MKTHLKICNSLTQDERTLALLTAAKVPDSALENPGPRAIRQQPTLLLTSSPSVSVPRPTTERHALPTNSTRTATPSQGTARQSTTLYVPALKRSKSLHDGHGGVRTLAKVLPPRELQDEFSSDICRLFIAMNTAWAAAENPEFHTFIHKWVGPSPPSTIPSTAFYSALHCRLHNEVSKTMFGFVCSLQTLLDCHASGPDLSPLGILNPSHPTLMATQVSDEMRARSLVCVRMSRLITRCRLWR
jgi:hypothetical protein